MVEKAQGPDKLKRYLKGQKQQAQNYFSFSGKFIGVTLTILTLLWSFNLNIPTVSYMLMIAFVFYINNIAINSKIVHEIDDGDIKALDQLSPWISFAENTYGVASTLVLTSFMIIFYSAMSEDIVAATLFLLTIWILLGVYRIVRSRVNKNKEHDEFEKAKRRIVSIKTLFYFFEIAFLALLWLDFLQIFEWIGPLF